jgi:hypothetical protein
MAGAGEGVAVCGYWWEGSECQRRGEGALSASERPCKFREDDDHQPTYANLGGTVCLITPAGTCSETYTGPAANYLS